MRLFKNHVHYHLIFQELMKEGVGIKVGGLENFSNINKRGGAIIWYSRAIPFAIIVIF